MTYDEELIEYFRDELSTGKVEIVSDSSNYFTRLADEFPTVGSRIDWTKVSNSWVEVANTQSDEVTQFVNFFNAAVDRYKLAGQVICMGDSATQIAMIFPVDLLRKKLDEILSIPQHHYFVAEDFSWCLVFTFEGDMAFGWRN